MIKSQINIGGHYAFRNKPAELEGLVEQVEVRAWLGSGLWDIEVVRRSGASSRRECKSVNLIVPWSEHSELLSDENKLLQLLAKSGEEWKGQPDDPRAHAINLIFESTGAGDWHLHDTGRLAGLAQFECPIAKQILQSAKLSIDPEELPPPAFVDRNDILHLSFGSSLELVQAVIRAAPARVSSHLNRTEKRWEKKWKNEPDEFWEDLIYKWRSGWTLVREWIFEAKNPSEHMGSSEQQITLETALEPFKRKLQETEQRLTTDFHELLNMLDKVSQAN